MIAITGATGQLGRLVIDALLKRSPNETIVAAVRDPAKAADLKARGVEVRQADYDKPETLRAAFAGVDKVLLVSSNEIGRRFVQHKAAIDAAKAAGVKFIAYTSLLRADTSPLSIAGEHIETERYIQASGLPYAFLRNGWYSENETAGIAGVIAHSAYIGASGEGRYAWASRADYADAAAVTLLNPEPGRIYELAGDTALTMAELATETAKVAGKPIAYHNMSEADLNGALRGFGLPSFLADLLSDSSAKAANGALFDDTRTLSRLIGRPTTPVATTIAQALEAVPA